MEGGRASRWMILLGIAIPAMMVEMAGTSVFVALEAVTSDLRVSIYRSVWLSTMYLATNAMMIPLAGWMDRLLGTKRVMLLGIAVFTACAFLSGSAADFESLVIFRALQGVGDGPIIPVTTALLLSVFPPGERGKAMAGLMLAIGVSPALGPFVASWVVEELGWRWVFYMNVPLGLISLTSTMLLIPASRPSGKSPGMHWPGMVLLAAGTGSLQLFLDRGQHYDWLASPFIAGLLVVAAVTLALFLILTLTGNHRTVLDLRLLADRAFVTGNGANMLLFGALYGGLATKVIYLQMLMGFGSREVGIYQATVAGSMLLSSVLVGVLTDRVHPRWPLLMGVPICAYGMYLASRLTLQANMAAILEPAVIIGLGLSFLAVPVSVCLFATIKPGDMANASVLNSYFSVISGSASLALVTSLLMHRIDVNSIRLAETIRYGNPAVQHILHAVEGGLAYPLIFGQMLRQAAMFSFNDVLYVLALAILFLALYVPFARRAATRRP
jgi:DHA2 family multidrug resistance protein